MLLMVSSILCLGSSVWTLQWPQSFGDRVDSDLRNFDEDTPEGQVYDTSHQFFSHPQVWGSFAPRLVQGQFFPDKTEVKAAPINIAGRREPLSDGTLDSMQYCKCLTGDKCDPQAKHPPIAHYACAAGQILCCYDGNFKRPPSIDNFKPNVVKEKPYRIGLSGETRAADLISDSKNYIGPSKYQPKPLSPIPSSPLFKNDHPFIVGPSGVALSIALHASKDKPLLISETSIGSFSDPALQKKRESFTGYSPKKPSSTILVGPKGPTGLIGPPSASKLKEYDTNGSANENSPLIGGRRQGDVLVGRNGATLGEYDPYLNTNPQASDSAQRHVLVGPDGPTGMIGPLSLNQIPVLVGPGGPTGHIGPAGHIGALNGYNRGILVGPNGPTGVIGPSGLKPRIPVYRGYTTRIGPQGLKNQKLYAYNA